MKTLIEVALVVLAVCMSVVAQASRPKLFDFREPGRNKPPTITSAQNRKVLAAVFPEYLTDARFCKDDVDTSGSENYLAAMRKAGQIVPDVVDVAVGSFTAPRQQETAYIIWVGECNASHADNFGSKRLAVFAGNKLVFNQDVDFKNGILKKTDLDMDGVDELLLSGGDMNQGIVVETAALYEVRNRKLVTIQDFQKVFEDSCATLMRDSRVEASVIFLGSARPGERPALQVENYRSGCGRTKRWKLISKGPMPF
jgi:hypothetical protein